MTTTEIEDTRPYLDRLNTPPISWDEIEEQARHLFNHAEHVAAQEKPWQHDDFSRMESYLTRIRQLRQWVNDLQAGNVITCVYCGHRYGPDPGTPVAMADVLKQHVEQCPDHPLAAAKKRIEELEGGIQEAFDYANNRWGEWGDRAIATHEILEKAFYRE